MINGHGRGCTDQAIYRVRIHICQEAASFCTAVIQYTPEGVLSSGFLEEAEDSGLWEPSRGDSEC